MTDELHEIQRLNDALFWLQSNVKGVVRDAEGAYNNYATLSAVWAELRPLLTHAGLLVTIVPGKFEQLTDNTYIVPVSATITHVPSSESVRYEMAMPVSKFDPQAYASAITYSQRYLLMSVFSMPPYDDDGQAAGGMSPEELENYVSGLDACESLAELKQVFADAYRAAGSDSGAIKAIGAAKNVRKNQLACSEAVDRNQDLLVSIRDAIEAGALQEARSAYDELSRDDQMALNLAPSKGGFWTTHEVKVMKSNDWHAARK